MNKAVKSSALVIASLWVGAVFCLGFVVAPYLFILAARNSPAIPDSGVAAELIGPLLYSSDVASLVVGVGLIAALIFLRRRNEVPLGSRLYMSEIAVAIAVLCAAVNYWAIGPRLKAVQGLLRAQLGALDRPDAADPLFREFTELHQLSTAVFMAGFIAALLCLVCMTQFRSRVTAVSHRAR